MCRRIIACVLVCVLAGADWPVRATSAPVAREIGVVTQAVEARVGTTVLSSGASLFEGDRVRTEAGGGMNARSGKALLYLPGQSEVTLRRANESARVQLEAGTVVFSVAQAAAIEIGALGAQIRPAADVATNAQISIAGPKMLDIRAQRGALIFSYNGESEVIEEGSAIRVVLDQPKEGSAGGSDNPPYPGQGPKRSSKKPKGFFFLLLGGAAAATTIVLIKTLESPDSPN